ncbi:hypothetical protein [Mammaliicoccus sciuri]|uniref:hypothetical protein n=1 Tax=Mammaliicoccus sciuri TaxID=1296 RepID=UPI001FB1F2F4|nr:hypothetical protein [Mammaliicoccus sciuri]MCJ0941270.1 hypothetical protein [Mammaliicoccus sciuri]
MEDFLNFINQEVQTSTLWVLLLKSLLVPIATVIIGYFTIKTTSKNFRRSLLDNLDSKSEWRKTIFCIAGNDKITIKEVYQLRAALRFKEKSDPKKLFDKMNVIMIKYCNHIIDNEPDLTTNIDIQKTIRVFARYLLKDHWEKNQNKKGEFKPRKKEYELCIETLNEFLKLNNSEYKDKKNTCKKTKFAELYKQAQEIVNKNTQ